MNITCSADVSGDVKYQQQDHEWSVCKYVRECIPMVLRINPWVNHRISCAWIFYYRIFSLLCVIGHNSYHNNSKKNSIIRSISDFYPMARKIIMQ